MDETRIEHGQTSQEDATNAFLLNRSKTRPLFGSNIDANAEQTFTGVQGIVQTFGERVISALQEDKSLSPDKMVAKARRAGSMMDFGAFASVNSRTTNRDITAWTPELRAVPRSKDTGYSDADIISFFEGYFAGKLMTGQGESAVVALAEVAKVQKKPFQEVVGNYTPILVDVRTKHPELNEIPGRGGHKTIDAGMERFGFRWDENAKTYVSSSPVGSV